MGPVKASLKHNKEKTPGVFSSGDFRYIQGLQPNFQQLKIEHLAFWVQDLETVRSFYMKYFGMTCDSLYHNPRKQFSSYFLSTDETGARIEIMQRPDIAPHEGKKGLTNGITHLAISVGSREAVDALTHRLRTDKFIIESEPRTTGDGYYESVVLDPEGNLIEITV